MNKTKKGALGAAGVGVVALAMFGGGTFALWSDFDKITGNETEAGHLVLNLTGTGPISNVEEEAIAPGEHRMTDFFVASADLDGVPTANLSFTLQNLVDKENGCPSNSEAKAEDDKCELPNDEGEFSEEAYVSLLYTEPTTQDVYKDGKCDEAKLRDWNLELTSLDALEDKQYQLGDLKAGEGVCVRFDIGLPYKENFDQNVSQGDSATFDIQWDLTQSKPTKG